MVRAIRCACPDSSSSRSGAGATTSWQIPCELGRGDDRVRRRLAARRARDDRRELAAEVDPLLGQQADPGRPGRGERVVAVGGRGHEPHALAVVPAPGGLEDAGEAERLDVGDARDARVPGAGDAERREPLPHHRLVLRVDQRLRPGTAGDPVGLERVEVLGRDVLVVEGDDLAAGRGGAQVGEVAVVADELVGDHLGGRDALALGEQPQREAHRSRGLGHHPGQLSPADDGDGRRWLGHESEGITRSRSAARAPGWW